MTFVALKLPTVALPVTDNAGVVIVPVKVGEAIGARNAICTLAADTLFVLTDIALLAAVMFACNAPILEL